MRSQASKPSPKKGELSKIHSKSITPKVIKKKKVPAKKVKKIVSKALVKQPKKSSAKDDSSSKSDDDAGAASSPDSAADNAKPGTSKLRTDSPVKKTKSGPKEKKDTLKTLTETNTKRAPTKKSNTVNKKRINPKAKMNKDTKQTDTKYKTNRETPKKVTKKVCKTKTIVKKADLKKKSSQQTKQANTEKDKSANDSTKDRKSGCETIESAANCCQSNIDDEELDNHDNKDEATVNAKTETKSDNNKSASPSTASKISTISLTETTKVEIERPPKFFTSTRLPRTVDIDVKCLKNSKGNLSVSERFLSMKLETKTEENSKDKNVSNTLISQGPEIDVYTFTEKVDSPKNILSDFRSPINKNIGRVRPIARVKGTIIDKKTESEKKKYSPHRPIEEVVKQLKANKRSEEVDLCQSTKSTLTICHLDKNDLTDVKEAPIIPKPIVSKSYKMVARKSSVTGKPFSPIHFLDSETMQHKNDKPAKTNIITKKVTNKSKKQNRKGSSSDEELDTCKFALNSKTLNHSSSEESSNESNDENDTKDSSESDTPKAKKTKLRKYKRIIESMKKTTSKELKELSKDSLIDLKDECALLGGDKPSKRRLKLLSMWTGPKKHRMASLNAIAKVHCLYENESRTHMELGLMKTVDRQALPSTSKSQPAKKKDSKPKDIEKHESSASESEYESKIDKKDDSSDSSDDSLPQRTLRGVPGIRSAGKYWDPKSSSSSSEDSESDTKKRSPEKKKIPKSFSAKSDSDKPTAKMKKTAGVPIKKKRNRNEVVMDLKDMVVQKRMASLNASAILAASYEKRSPKSNKDETTSDSGSDESFSQKSKNGVSSGVKSEMKNDETKKEGDESQLTDRKQKVEVIVNQDTDVTITGVYSTHHHEGFCTVSGMQYRISSTSHTQTTATANCEKEGCPKEDTARYTPLSALSSMQPPAEHNHPPHPVPEIGGLARRAGCSSAFSAPSPAAHHEPGYYQPAGPLIKETSADAERALARYHPPPHYHAPHPSMLQQYGPPYYPDLCYGRYYRPPAPYHMPPPQPDAQMVGVGSEPYPPSQYYGTPPCYQHSPQRIPYVEYRCPCPLNACPKNVLIGPVTGKAPTGSGPADLPSALVQPGGAFRPKVRACALDTASDTHGSGKDPPLEPEPPAAADAPHQCPLPAIGGASPKREFLDVRDKLRIAGPPEALGPPSPARGSAGVCAPQPPPIAPRRARLGKDMARRSLAGDDTGLLLSVPRQQQNTTTPTPSDADDDVMEISPPVCGPIDLSSSDERTTPLVDVKKENEGPTYASARKPEAQALKEHNNCILITDSTTVSDGAKAVKRRYSRPKLEIDMKDSQLEDVCKTNGIGEHVKLQKRRKVSGDHTDIGRIETVTKEPKKKTTKKLPKTPITDKKSLKRKRVKSTSGLSSKKMLVETNLDEDLRSKSITTIEDTQVTKPKTKSAQILDNLIRKNSIERLDAKKYTSDGELDPAELFLSPNENISQNKKENDIKKTNINNNLLENTVNGVRPNTIAAVTQLIEKKLAFKNACKLETVDSRVTHSIKSVLESSVIKSEIKKQVKPEIIEEKPTIYLEKDASKCEKIIEKDEIISQETEPIKTMATCDSETAITVSEIPISKAPTDFEANISNEVNIDESQNIDENSEHSEGSKGSESIRRDRSALKRCKLTKNKIKGKNVAKLLISKRPAIKTDEATLVIEEACASPTPSVGFRGKARRRGCGSSRRGRRPRSPLTLLDFGPRAPPRWSNGWNWDGENYISRVYVSNDSRLVRTARCWSRMTHESGDSVARGDCVLLRASVARAQPFVARVASLWENPDDGEMMVSLVWYYRPEHTKLGRQPEDAPDEVFASKHRDANSVACIEDKCYVLNFKEYSRYRKRLKAIEAGVPARPSIVPPIPSSEAVAACVPNDAKLPPAVSPELVLFCRKIYDFRSKRIHVSNK
ncbi:uncharacterized protein LOC114249107 isoform X1 [Bombyx mandarina]|uniref:Uncharacterized protein LOC114249107 isoform X1 n=1 Tax=Bombyx mandarina TaxID=7092 RepID=A0A6J2K7W6_BOMMA|nr:uncharacterized protein LOC114249107 isoform X1 [Bombyx mandarina]